MNAYVRTLGFQMWLALHTECTNLLEQKLTAACWILILLIILVLNSKSYVKPNFLCTIFKYDLTDLILEAIAMEAIWKLMNIIIWPYWFGFGSYRYGSCYSEVNEYIVLNQVSDLNLKYFFQFVKERSWNNKCKNNSKIQTSKFSNPNIKNVFLEIVRFSLIQ